MRLRREDLAEGVTGRWVAIYALSGDDGVRYVGKTINAPLKRLSAHVRAADRGGRLPVHYWLRKLPERPNLTILEMVPPCGDWALSERHWIDIYRRLGRLLNLTDGGEGLHGHRLSAEHKAKLSAAHATGDNRSCLQCSRQFWRKRNEIDQGNDKFCSRSCYAASLKGVSRPVPIECKVAGIAAAAIARKARTRCKRGHAFTVANTYVNTHGSRVCRECRKIHKRTFWEAQHVAMA